jgi:hypothetical protein
VYQEWVELAFYLGIAVTATLCATRAASARLSTLDHRTGRHAYRPHVQGRRTLAAAGVAALAITAVFAKMTADSGILPGNVPPSLTELYLGL